MKTKPSITTLGHKNGTKSKRILQNTFIENMRWKQDLVYETFWSWERYSKLKKFYSIRLWNKGDENKS